MPKTDERAGQATDRPELERQIMDPNVPKNEREWWAAREIERLRTPTGEAGEMVALLRRDAKKLGGPLTETEMKGWVTPQRMLDAICAERFIAAADLISRLSATPIEALQQRVERLEGTLRDIVEGNLGDAPWQANYDGIRKTARAALGDDVG